MGAFGIYGGYQTREGGLLSLSLRQVRVQQGSNHRKIGRAWVLLILGLPASRAVRNKWLLFKPPSLWYLLQQRELTKTG